MEEEKYCGTERRLGGEPGRAAEFAEKHQLLRKDLWELFTDQFRKRPDAPDGGWRGEYWGKMMRGGCFVYQVTGNRELYETLKQTVADMMATADPDGRISSYARETEFRAWDMWCRKYVLLGFEYFYEICREEDFKKKILEAACRHLDYIVSRVGPEEGQISVFDTSCIWGSINSCSILEPVVKLYNLTGEPRYLKFADYLVSCGGCRDGSVPELAIRNEIPPYRYPVVKAYETMSYFEGISEYYRVVKRPELREAVLHFTDAVLATDYTVIGNCGCTHELFDNSTERQTEDQEEIMQETCVAVTFSKLLAQALRLSGNPVYADAMERTFYNSILGSINFGGNTTLRYDPPRGNGYAATAEFVRSIGGFTFDSYSPLYKSRRNRRTGGYKVIEGNKAYGCCACIGSAGVAVLPLTAVMEWQGGLCINHYISGKITAALQGKAVTAEAVTDYPYDGTVKLTLKSEEPMNFPVFLRMPGWSDGKIEISGSTETGKRGTYFKTEFRGTRLEVTLTFDRSARVQVRNGKAEVEKGCIVYALDCRNESIDRKAADRIEAEQTADRDFPCRSALRVTFSNGETVKMTDYASAGSNWDEEDCYLTVWMDRDGGNQ